MVLVHEERVQTYGIITMELGVLVCGVLGMMYASAGGLFHRTPLFLSRAEDSRTEYTLYSLLHSFALYIPAPLDAYSRYHVLGI